jgi:hypothetical protein
LEVSRVWPSLIERAVARHDQRQRPIAGQGSIQRGAVEAADRETRRRAAQSNREGPVGGAAVAAGDEPRARVRYDIGGDGPPGLIAHASDEERRSFVGGLGRRRACQGQRGHEQKALQQFFRVSA